MHSFNRLGCSVSAIAAGLMASTYAGTVLAESPRVAENRVVLVAKQDPGSFDYVSSVLTAMLLWIPTNVVEPLVYFNKDGVAEPGVAESWTISEDRKTYEFKLRKANFSDGTPVTVEDVIYSLNTMKGSPVAVYAAAYRPVTAIEKVDDRTVRVTLSRPSQAFWLAMGGVAGLIQPEHAASSRVIRPIGTGPYVLKSYTANSTLEFEANPHYWGERPGIDAVTVRIIEDNTTVLNALEAKEADAFPAATVQLLEQIRNRGLEKQLSLVPYPQIGEPTYVVFNQKLDLDLRKAMAMALDREAYKDAFGADSGVQTTCTFALPHRPWFQPDNAESCPYPFDYEKAMAAAPNYASTELDYAAFTGLSWVADITIPSLQGAGFKIRRNDMDLARFSQLIFQGRPPQFDITAMSSNDNPARYVCAEPSAAGWTTYCSQAYTAALAAADSAASQTEYLSKMNEAAKILRDDAVVVPLFDQPGLALLSPDLKGFTEPRVHVAVEIAKLHW